LWFSRNSSGGLAIFAPPVQADERGHYPVPIPGVWKEV
jgi:hypothetical protein